MNNIECVEGILAYEFKDKELLELALTHSSWANEAATLSHNERQEYLGDAVLELCVSWELFARFPEVREGELTRLRSLLVNTQALADLARSLKLDNNLYIGKGEESQGGRRRDSLLSDALEAVLGAVFEDGGFNAAYKVVLYIFKDRWPTTLGTGQQKDNKTLLQELSQRLFKHRPVYSLLESNGPEHAKSFKVCLELPDGQNFIADGPSLKRAEQEAARIALNNYC